MRQINRKKLDEVFDIEKVQSEITEMRETLEEISEIDELNTNEILQKNIERANWFLDQIQNEVEGGSMSGQLLAAAGSIMNVITSTAGAYVANSINLDTLGIKKDTLSLKEQELELKKAIANAKMTDTTQPQTMNVTNNNTVITANREDILRMLNAPTEPITLDINKIGEKITC